MRAIIEPVGPPDAADRPQPIGRRLLWFTLLTLGGVGVTAIVAYGLRWLLHLH